MPPAFRKWWAWMALLIQLSHASRRSPCRFYGTGDSRAPPFSQCETARTGVIVLGADAPDTQAQQCSSARQKEKQGSWLRYSVADEGVSHRNLRAPDEAGLASSRRVDRAKALRQRHLE